MMQQRFEFDAPKTYNFLTLPKVRDPNDYAIDLTDSNDYWFMITHVEVSPLKERGKDEDEEEEDEREEKPVVRKEVQVKDEGEVRKMQSSEVIPNKVIIKPVRKISRKTELPTRINRLAAPQERLRKTVTPDSLPHRDRLQNKSKQAVQKPKASQQAQEKVTDQPKKEKTTEQIDEGAKQSKLTKKSLGHPAKSKDHAFSRPCPFPPRIQREWQRKEKKDWHSLSPSAKCQAEKSMASLKHEKQAREGKEQPERKKEKKSPRFRF